jgi:hypothetical protein
MLDKVCGVALCFLLWFVLKKVVNSQIFFFLNDLYVISCFIYVFLNRIKKLVFQ